MPLPKWGGVSLFVCSPHSKRGSISSNCSESLFSSNRSKFSDKQGKKGQKLDFICLAWCFLGKIGDKKGQNTNIFLKSREEGGVLRWLACLPFGVSTGGRWSGNSCYLADVSKIGQDTARRSAFCPLFLALRLVRCL